MTDYRLKYERLAKLVQQQQEAYRTYAVSRKQIDLIKAKKIGEAITEFINPKQSSQGVIEWLAR